MDGVRDTGSHWRHHFGTPILVVLSFIMIAQSVHAVSENNLNHRMRVYRESAELCLETATTLEDALNYMDQTTESSLIGRIKTLHDFSSALEKDIQVSTEGGFTILRSHTLEQIGNFGLGEMANVVDVLKKTGRLPTSFNLPATFGAEELATALSKHIGSGKADIDTITNYLDGLNKACWAVVGYMVGGPEGAKVYQSIAGTGAKLLRKATLPLFNRAVLAWRRQGEQLARDWRVLQERRIYDGLPVQKISEVYGENLLMKNGLSKDDIKELDAAADGLNGSLLRMKKDFGIKKIETLKRSKELELGGVYIDPELICAGEGGKEIREDVLQSRQSCNELSWPVKLPNGDESTGKEVLP